MVEVVVIPSLIDLLVWISGVLVFAVLWRVITLAIMQSRDKPKGEDQDG